MCASSGASCSILRIGLAIEGGISAAKRRASIAARHNAKAPKKADVNVDTVNTIFDRTTAGMGLPGAAAIAGKNWLQKNRRGHVVFDLPAHESVLASPGLPDRTGRRNPHNPMSAGGAPTSQDTEPDTPHT